MDDLPYVPPGFRFHPTDEELVDYYLRKKVASKEIDLGIIKDIDLYKMEPWDLQEQCRIGVEERDEWYLFSHKDKKYPTGNRTNRATAAGFWKATGRDKPIYTKRNLVVGMRKTLVFYMGRAPTGQKSDWIMHEYRLETVQNGPPQEEGWVVCRVFKKRATAVEIAAASIPRPTGSFSSSFWYDDQVSFMPELDMELLHHNQSIFPLHQLEMSSPKINPIPDWELLDKLVASQLGHGDHHDGNIIIPNELNHCSSSIDASGEKLAAGLTVADEHAASTSSCHMWK